MVKESGRPRYALNRQVMVDKYDNIINNKEIERIIDLSRTKMKKI